MENSEDKRQNAYHVSLKRFFIFYFYYMIAILPAR